MGVDISTLSFSVIKCESKRVMIKLLAIKFDLTLFDHAARWQPSVGFIVGWVKSSYMTIAPSAVGFSIKGGLCLATSIWQGRSRQGYG